MIYHKTQILSKVDLLSELNLHELEELAEDFRWVDYPQGADIISQGQEGTAFYVLTEGKAEVLLFKKGLEPLRVDNFTPSDVFGEICLITGKSADSTVRCTEKCSVLALDSEHFARMLVRWPKLYETFLQKLSKQLSLVNVDLWEAKHKEFLRSGIQLNQFQYKFYGLWGSTRTTREVENKLKELAQTAEHLLLIGERGTGRQMLAWYLHKRQFGESAPFIVVDGRHFDQQWGDLMFVPHDQGKSMPNIKASSLLDLAEGGTLFIREINLISPRAQLKLALALSAPEIKCRIVGSLKAEPELLSERLVPHLKDCFTQTYKITPLFERKRDIPVIAEGILEKLAQQYNRKKPTLDQEATRLLLSHDYRQGNVTELIQVIERAFFLAEEDFIGLEHLFFGPTAKKMGHSINILAWGWVNKLVKKAVFPLWGQRLSAIIFITIIMLLLLSPNAKIAAVLFLLVWGLWWPALTIISPFLGRVWCGICPFSFVMEQIQKRFHLNRPIPDLLKKYDYLFITFLFLLILWTEAVSGMRYNPVFTGLWLISIMAAASLVGVLFPRHTWCRHLCPLGSFVGMASIGGMLEVRADPTVCLNKCTTYECYRGTGNISGCPMSQYAPFVDNNLDCKLCLHCARSCPNNAIQINLRIPAREVWHLVRVNQGFVVFIGVSLAILFPIQYFEAVHQFWPLEKWRFWFSLFFWGTGITAGLLTWLIAQPFKTKAASRRIKLFFALIPFVLSGYIVYQLRFLPGAGSLMVGLRLRSPSGINQTLFIHALSIGQAVAIAFGLAVSILTVVMVYLRSKKTTAVHRQPIPMTPPGNLKM